MTPAYDSSYNVNNCSWLLLNPFKIILCLIIGISFIFINNILMQHNIIKLRNLMREKHNTEVKFGPRWERTPKGIGPY